MLLGPSGSEIATWPLPDVERPDAGVLDELAHLQLAAHRLGCSIHLRDACPDLLGLLELAGLTEVVPPG